MQRRQYSRPLNLVQTFELGSFPSASNGSGTVTRLATYPACRFVTAAIDEHLQFMDTKLPLTSANPMNSLWIKQ